MRTLLEVYIIITVTNVGLGLSIFGSEFGRFDDTTMFWIYMSYIFYIIFLHTTLYFIIRYCWKGREQGQDDTTVEFNDEKVKITEKDKDHDTDEKKKASPDSMLRWGGFIAFVVPTTLIVIVLSVLIALPKET